MTILGLQLSKHLARARTEGVREAECLEGNFTHRLDTQGKHPMLVKILNVTQ